MKPFFRSTSPEDLLVLAVNMCSADVAEAYHLARLTPLEALTESCADSETLTIEWDGKVMAILGVSGKVGEPGSPWMLSAKGLKQIAKGLVQVAPAVITNMLNRHGYLGNLVWSKNHGHIRLLKLLGFTFNGVSELRNGETFLWFEVLKAAT